MVIVLVVVMQIFEKVKEQLLKWTLIKLNEDENIGKLWYMDVYHSFPFFQLKS